MMIGPKDRKFLYRRMEIAESDISADEKRAALAALKREMAEWDAWRKRTLALFVANLVISTGITIALMFAFNPLVGFLGLIPLFVQAFYVAWKADR